MVLERRLRTLANKEKGEKGRSRTRGAGSFVEEIKYSKEAMPQID